MARTHTINDLGPRGTRHIAIAPDALLRVASWPALTLFVLVAAILLAIPSLLRTLWELVDARRKAEVEYENARTRATAPLPARSTTNSLTTTTPINESK